MKTFQHPEFHRPKESTSDQRAPIGKPSPKSTKKGLSPALLHGSKGILPILLENPRRPNKAKGKDVKTAYRATLMVGFVVALTGVSLLFRADYRPSNDDGDFTLARQEVVQMEEIEQTKQEIKAPPPPRPPVPVEVPNDVVLDDDILDLDVTLDLNAEMLDIPPPPPVPVDDQADDEVEVFVVVEQMPQVIGGNRKVYEFLDYPDIARQAGIEGMVVIQIVVGAEGVPTDPFVARSAGEVLDIAASNAVMKLRFEPGRQRGKAVPVRLAIPIRFRLKDAANSR